MKPFFSALCVLCPPAAPAGLHDHSARQLVYGEGIDEGEGAEEEEEKQRGPACMHPAAA